MENKFIDVNIRFKSSTIEKLEQIVNYINTRSKLLNEPNSQLITIEEMIRGATIREIEKIETFHHQIFYKGDKKLGGKYTLKNNIKEILKEKNMKQLDLSELTGIDRSNISMIVNNRNQPSADFLFRIWVALDFYPLEQMFYRETT